MSVLNLVGKRRRIPAILNLVHEVREDFGLFLRDLKLPAIDVQLWKVVLSEALTNAIKHGAGGKGGHFVEIEWLATDEAIELSVTDPGKGPPERLQRNPTLPEDLVANGRGLYIIRDFADDWQHWRSPGGYRLMIRKRHPEIVMDLATHEELVQALDEIGLCYESLAAFYRLGRSLLESENAHSFVNAAIHSLRPAVKCDDFHVRFSPTLHESLLDDLQKVVGVGRAAEDSVVMGRVLETGEECVWEAPEEVDEDALLRRYGCGCCCPVKAFENTIGVITLCRHSNKSYLLAGDLSMLRTFADLIGIAVANADHVIQRTEGQRKQREWEIASDIQRMLLAPDRIPESDLWRLIVRRESARQVGGDYVEACLCDDGSLLLVQVDVMGKGIPAALFATVFRTVLHMHLNVSKTLDELVIALNGILCRDMSKLTMFATCCFAHITPEGDRLEIINAGHCPALLSRGDQILREMKPTGPPLGLFPDARYELQEAALTGSESLLMITDGLYEAADGGKVWSWEDFRAHVETNLPLDPDQLWDSMQSRAGDNADDDGRSDDQTLIYWESKRCAKSS